MSNNEKKLKKSTKKYNPLTPEEKAKIQRGQCLTVLVILALIFIPVWIFQSC